MSDIDTLIRKTAPVSVSVLQDQNAQLICENAELAEENAVLKVQNAHLRGALEQFANPDNWAIWRDRDGSPCSYDWLRDITMPPIDFARAALEG